MCIITFVYVRYIWDPWILIQHEDLSSNEPIRDDERAHFVASEEKVFRLPTRCRHSRTNDSRLDFRSKISPATKLWMAHNIFELIMGRHYQSEGSRIMWCAHFMARSQNCEERHFAMSVYLSAWKNSAPFGRIFIKFDIRVFFFKYVEIIQVSLKSDKNNGYVAWRPM